MWTIWATTSLPGGPELVQVQSIMIVWYIENIRKQFCYLDDMTNILFAFVFDCFCIYCICITYTYIWATAFIYFDEKMIWRIAGFEEMLVSPAKQDQNEMGELQKRDRFWCLSYSWTCCYSFSRFNIPQLVLESDSRMKTSRQGNRQMADKVRRKKTRSKTRSEGDQTPPRQDTQPATAVLDKCQVLALSRSAT